MATSNAESVEEYLAELPEERRQVIAAVREMVNENLPEGYQETMNWGMISWEIPLERYPETYNGKPLGYIGLAAQKRHYGLYMMAIYTDGELEKELREAFDREGKKLDMGKSCIRFKRIEDLPIEDLAGIVGAVPVERYIEAYERSRSGG